MRPKEDHKSRSAVGGKPKQYAKTGRQYVLAQALLTKTFRWPLLIRQALRAADCLAVSLFQQMLDGQQKVRQRATVYRGRAADDAYASKMLGFQPRPSA